MASNSDDVQKIRQAEQRAFRKRKVKAPPPPSPRPSFTRSSSSTISKAPIFQFCNASFQNGYILCQSLQKQNLNTIQTTPSIIPSATPSAIPSDSRERPKVQTPAWFAESKATEEKTVQKFNSTTKQTELAKKGYPFKFDLKNSYHHIDIFGSQQTYLSIFWVIKGATKYFVFTVSPFGLSFAPFVFTKAVRSLVKHWRCKNCLFS